MAIYSLNEELHLQCKEYTVIRQSLGSLFSHMWFIGTENKIDPGTVKKVLGDKLKLLNDDYRVERQHALTDIFVDLIPNDKFYEFLKIKGKKGGQTKFPGVLKGDVCDEWKKFIEKTNPSP